MEQTQSPMLGSWDIYQKIWTLNTVIFDKEYIKINTINEKEFIVSTNKL